MKILTWRWSRSEPLTRTCSPFAHLLPTVRQMRESRQWPEVSTEAAIAQRAARVADARKNLSYHPTSPERFADGTDRPEWPYWAWYAFLFLNLLAVIIAALWSSMGDTWNTP